VSENILGHKTSNIAQSGRGREQSKPPGYRFTYFTRNLMFHALSEWVWDVVRGDKILLSLTNCIPPLLDYNNYNNRKIQDANKTVFIKQI